MIELVLGPLVVLAVSARWRGSRLRKREARDERATQRRLYGAGTRSGAVTAVPWWRLRPNEGA